MARRNYRTQIQPGSVLQQRVPVQQVRAQVAQQAQLPPVLPPVLRSARDSGFRSTPRAAGIPGMMDKIVDGTLVTFVAATTTLSQTVTLPTSLQPLVGKRIIKNTRLILNPYGVMPTGYTAEILRDVLFETLIVKIYQGAQLQHELSAFRLSVEEGGFEALLEPDDGAFDGMTFGISGSGLPPGAANPNEWFLLPRLIFEWA